MHIYGYTEYIYIYIYIYKPIYLRGHDNIQVYSLDSYVIQPIGYIPIYYHSLINLCSCM